MERIDDKAIGLSGSTRASELMSPGRRPIGDGLADVRCYRPFDFSVGF